MFISLVIKCLAEVLNKLTSDGFLTKSAQKSNYWALYISIIRRFLMLLMFMLAGCIYHSRLHVGMVTEDVEKILTLYIQSAVANIGPCGILDLASDLAFVSLMDVLDHQLCFVTIAANPVLVTWLQWDSVTEPSGNETRIHVFCDYL